MSRDSYGEIMDEDEIAEFLENQGIGTLSMGNESGGYGIPMSFGYDRMNDRCILQLAFAEDSLKAEYIEAGNPVTLSTHDWQDMYDWRSVVMHGELRELPPGEDSLAGGIFAAFSKIASPEVFQRPLPDLDFTWYELRIERVHGRKAER